MTRTPIPFAGARTGALAGKSPANWNFLDGRSGRGDGPRTTEQGVELPPRGIDFGAAEPVVCADWKEGQAASLRRGVEVVAHEADAAVLTLGDTPRITAQAIARFADIAAEHRAHVRVRAVYDGRPGHPFVLGSAYFPRIAELRGDVGAREVLKQIGAVAIECGHLCSAVDVDTPEALEQLRG